MCCIQKESRQQAIGGLSHMLPCCRNHVGPVYQLAWSSDSRLLVSASKDSTLKVSWISGADTAGTAHLMCPLGQGLMAPGTVSMLKAERQCQE